ncbi:chromatin/chromatin-binding, or -regulatory protein [Lithospermum erythrorhizon]|uniref:HMG-Y-related protein A n=1 Tax=Lithospermum erythrorhizon TaxID=34254 RepID=A0AAV3QHG4_LITER
MGLEGQHINTTTAPQPAPTPNFPSYPEMIMRAIDELNDKKGSNKSTIAKHLESTYGTLPPAHSALLSHHLNKMKQMGQLLMVKNNYMMPNDPNAPPRRGRGRPPKPKAPLPLGYVPPPPRPRGRPPKDPHSLNLKLPSVGSVSGRKRGRPPKSGNSLVESVPRPIGVNSSVELVLPPIGVSGGERRGRGRPPKERDPNSPTLGLTSWPTTVGSITGRKRGRPSKSGNSSVISVPLTNGVSGSERRGRGRPPKVRPVGLDLEA